MSLPSISPDYVVVRHIDSGGQADVFEVHHVRGGRYAARVLREAWDPIAREDFRGSIARQLRAAGPGVVPVLAYNTTVTRPFMIMEYMPNGSLAAEVERRQSGFGLREALSIAVSIAEAVADSHAKNVVHGDVKPGNVLRNRAEAWVLGDFGSAVTVGSKEVLRASRWFGTPAYAAPEQLQGVTVQASDVYPIGVMLCELLTGSRELTVSGFVDVGARCGSSADGLPILLAQLTAADPRMRPSAREAAGLLRNLLRRLNDAEPVIPPLAGRSTASKHTVPQPAVPQPAVLGSPVWLKALGLLNTAFVAAAAANRSTKSWDESVARYRGSDGKFRGNGLFG